MKKAKKYLLPAIAVLLVTALIGLGVLYRVDKWVQDWLYQHPGVSSSDIIIFGIDEDALDILGPYNTWDRTIIASALEILASDPENKPAVTAIDILYAGHTAPEADERLASAAKELGNVVTACIAQFGSSVTWENGHAVSMDTSAVIGLEEPFESLKEATVQGHVNAMTDSDGILRHALLYVEPEDGRIYSMAHETARLYLETQGKTLRDPDTNRQGAFYVTYTAQPGDYYDGINLAMLLTGRIPSGYWANKIVLIGPYAPALQDAYFTTINKGMQMYGVEYQANVLQSLLESNFKTEVPDLPQLIVLFVLCAMAMVLFMRLKAGWSSAVCAGMIALSAAITYLLFKLGLITHPLWLPVAILILFAVSIGIHYAETARERHRLALENERIGAELALATRIQTSSLPKEFPPFPDRKEFELYASMTPAKEVGGDLYDFFLIDDDHLALVIGDVSGKGVPAALFMMVALALIRNTAVNKTSPARILTTVNQQICARNPEEMFVTVWMGILEISTGKLTATNAGHEYPALKQPDGSFELFKDKHGVVIGAMDGVRYREYTIQLEPGSKLFVYTDGVAEATDSNEQLFGTERMITALRQADSAAPAEVLHTVRSSVDQFVGKAPQFDDLTMLCLQYQGPQPQEAEPTEA